MLFNFRTPLDYVGFDRKPKYKEVNSFKLTVNSGFVVFIILY